MYDAAAVAAGASGLDREGMVLVALMSGGDYLPEGVPGCGVKVACEAAKAGFGRDLCRIKKADRDALTAWKTKLLHELRTNESGLFRTRHKALEIPESFPNLEVLGYYTHPVVSRQATVDRLKRDFPPSSTVDVVGLREFARETFDWEFRNGAVKLIRVLAPSLLVQRFLDRSVSADNGHNDLALKQKEESALIKAISSKRVHFSTDATPELRVSFVPADIVKLDLSTEPEEEVEAFGRNGIALNSDDEFEEAAEELGGEQPKTGSGKKPFDPLQPDLVWIPETLAKLGVPLTVEDWEEKQRAKEQRGTARVTRKAKAKATDMPVGALDKYVKMTKSVTTKSVASTSKDFIGMGLGSPPPSISSQCHLPAPRGRSKQLKKSSAGTQTSKPTSHINPWTLASSHVSPKAAKSSFSSQVPKSRVAYEPILISSSPVAPASPAAPNPGMIYDQTTPTRTKRLQSPSVDLLSPIPSFALPPSPTKQISPTAQKLAEKEVLAAAQTKPVQKARPFKRVKSGAENNSGTTGAQKSIKDFGRVLKNATSSQVNAKVNTAPIELLSDDDDGFPLPRFKLPPLSRPASLNVEDDPFGPPPALRRTSVPPKGQPASLSQPERETDQHRIADGIRHETKDNTTNKTIGQTKTITTAAPKSATTKLFIPRQSLNGLGYFTEVEVSREEADLMTAAHDSPRLGPGPQLGKGKRLSRKAWRLSEIEVLDLTGED
jgi:Holliday junction resolvase YEN1